MTWKRVCAFDEVPSDALKRFEIDGIAIVMVAVGDEVRAIPPSCPHMEEPLDQSGICSAGVLTCTKHLWQWDILTGKERGDAEKPLLMYETRRDGDDVMVFLAEELVYEFDDDEEDDDFQW